MAATEKFRVSSHLKDVIGRDLVTNEFVAIFELVKNSFDAGATRVDIEFEPDRGTIKIVDDGSGMSIADIRSKWLFVAYSEKASPDAETYRDKIRPVRHLAGSKGIGRFSCDTLGTGLLLYSRKSTSEVVKLKIDWTRFERDSTEEFKDVGVSLGIAKGFPPVVNPDLPTAHGTVLVIQGARHNWDAAAIRRLRTDLAKLIDPFGTTEHVEVCTWLVDGSSKSIPDVDGPIGNSIAELLREKTSRIEVMLDGGYITSTLFDRGRKIYAIRERSPYEELEGAAIEGNIYFLNRSAKHTFTSRMGVRSVEFGSIFLFLNGFRIFPIGEEFDDTFGLNRRKQQGQSRFLGTRDLLGRVDVTARPKMFREVSSRDAGLVEDARSRALFEAIRRHMIFRLERYVVGVNWKDKLDHDRSTPDRLNTDGARERILSVVGALVRSKDVEILFYDEDLVRISDDPDQVTASALKVLSELAEIRQDPALREHVQSARRQVEELRSARNEAQLLAERALADRERADARVAALEKQAAFLGSSLDIDVDRLQLLMHQGQIHLGHLRSAVANAAHEMSALVVKTLLPAHQENAGVDDFEDLLATIRQSVRRTSVSLASATLSGDRLAKVLSFAPNIRIDLRTDKVHGDLLQFLGEYFRVRITGMTGLPDAQLDAGGLTLIREFSPVDMAVLADNLVDNARKAKASVVKFQAARRDDHVVITVVDDGVGIDEQKIDPSKLFERGYSGSANGTGLGLYNVRTIVSSMGGSIELVGDDGRARFEISFPEERS